jgi:hypothetical protein
LLLPGPSVKNLACISALSHNEFVAILGEAENAGGEVIQLHYVMWFSCHVSQRDQIIH